MAAVAPAPVVLRGHIDQRSLASEVVLVTGAGGGIGFEAARSLLALGAVIVVADIEQTRVFDAALRLEAEFGYGRVIALAADISDDEDVRRLVAAALGRFGKVDAVINNATFAPAGASVVETPIATWDRSYAVNLRGPALLARACLPGMLERRHGAFVCVSSTGGPFLAPYETMKTAQLALANTLDAELAGTGVVAFTIGPGLVPTPTAVAAIELMAPRLGMTVDEFWRMNKGAVVSVESAGAGFAASVAMAKRYAGQEISSTQALIDAGIEIPDEAPPREIASTDALRDACVAVRATLDAQAAGWKERSFFERQWMARDFKQRVGVPAERCLEVLSGIESGGPADRKMLERLQAFYVHLGELARGYVKDLAQRNEQMEITQRWADEVGRLTALV